MVAVSAGLGCVDMTGAHRTTPGRFPDWRVDLMGVATRVGRHVGRRGAYLLFLALLDLVIGYSLAQPTALPIPTTVLYRPFVTIMPMSAWITAWIVVGLGCLAAACWHPPRWLMFGLATLLKMAWASGYLVGWVGHMPLYVRGYQTAMIFGGLGLITYLVAGWQENRR